MVKKNKYPDSEYKRFIFDGFPLRLAPNGDMKFPALTRVLLPMECRDECYFRGFLRFVLDNSPEMSEKDRELTEKRLRGEYVKW